MCGIFGYIGNKNRAGELILEGLKTLEYRGYDSWGIVAKKIDGEMYIEKHPGKIGEAHLPDFISNLGIGHTRWATHGGVTQQNAHPHSDCSKKVFVVHNGIFENFADFKQELIRKGHKFMSQTDTEVIAHLIEEEMKKEKNPKKIMLKVFRKMQGLSAIIVFFSEEEQFLAIKNSAPLVFGQTANESIIASDSIAIRPYTKKVYYLDDNELLVLGKSSVQLYDWEGREKSISFIRLPYDLKAASLGKYKHFLHKEINEQPQVLGSILQTQIGTIKQLAGIIKKAYGTYIIGCGTAYYASLSGAYIFAKIAKRHINSWSASEFTYLLDFLKDTSLVICLSQSGETIDLISTVKEAKKKNAKIMAVTNVLGSTLYRLSDYKILLNAGPEKAVVSTKAFTVKIAVLYLLAYQLAGRLSTGVAELKLAIGEVQALLKKQEVINRLIRKLINHEHLFILGRGISYTAALESAMKIKEVSYIHAEAFAGGDLKHGPIALIEKGTPVIVFNPEDETYNDMISSTHEVKARGAYVIGVSSKRSPLFDEYIQVKNCNDATLIPNVVIAQLLGYYLAVSKNLDPDKPRNLAKSVTVK